MESIGNDVGQLGVIEPRYKRVEIFDEKGEDYLVFDGERKLTQKRAKGFKIEIELERVESL